MANIRLNVHKTYDQESLLIDSSVDWKGYRWEELMACIRKKNSKKSKVALCGYHGWHDKLRLK